MGFHEFHRIGAIPSQLVGTAQGFGLALGARGIDAFGAAIGRSAYPADHRIDFVAVTLSIGQPFHGNHAQAFAQQGAIGSGREGAAIATRRKCRRLAETHVHKNVVECVHSPCDHKVSLAQVKFIGSHGDGGKCTRTSGIGYAVGSTEIHAIGDAPRHHVAQQTWKRTFLPFDIMVADPLAYLVGFGFGKPCLAQRLQPDRSLQSAHHRRQQLLARGHPENHARAVTQGLAKLAAGGVIQHALGNDKRKQLRRVCGLYNARRHPKLERVKVAIEQKSPTLGIGLIARLGIGIVIIFQQPMAGWNVRDQIPPTQDVVPKTGGIERAGKQGANAHNR